MPLEFTLSDLAFAAHTFDGLTRYNEAYATLGRAVGKDLDLNRCDHRKELIVWLNRWGCRQFALDHHLVASESIRKWYEEVAGQLVDRHRQIWELNDSELEKTRGLYSALSQSTASYRIRELGKVRITVGPAGASKILFAVRPRAYIPWDDAIRKSLGYVGTGAGYVDYLRDVRDALKTLERNYPDGGLSLVELPSWLGKPDATVVAMVNAYLWIVHTRKLRTPSRKELLRWAEWSSNPEPN